MNHPAVFSDQFLPIFYEELKDMNIILDPFAGTGKIALIKDLGFKGKIICNDLEPEYATLKQYPVDKWHHKDAAILSFDNALDAIVTSPTYGNRMADSHNAKDNSKRITYTHQLGRKLNSENTGAMQWGNNYKQKHIRCYNNFWSILKVGGKLIINISDHIRKGEVIPVAEWTKNTLLTIGFNLVKTYEIPVKRMKFGQNSCLRIEHEYIFVFIK
jgi:DNA modification methylase